MTLLGDALRAALAAKDAKMRQDGGAPDAKLGGPAPPPQPPRATLKLPKPTPPVARPTVWARWIGAFSPNSVFDLSRTATRRRIEPLNSGVARQLSSTPSNEADIVLGLDFGTSTLKAVIRDATARQAYLVPFTGGIEESHLLTAKLFLTGGVYSLDGGASEIGDLKLRLLECKAPLPLAEFDDACGFLSLAIRHCRGWFLENYSGLYCNHKLNWTVNVGIPTRSYEDDRRVATFRRLAWAAANLASDANKKIIRAEDVGLYRQLSMIAYEKRTYVGSLGSFEFQPADVDVVPEIAAQIHGFVESSQWNSKSRPYMVLMDVGAGTIDTAFFCVMQQNAEKPRFIFYSSDVQPLGVVNLHRTRLRWIRDAIQAGGARTHDVESYLDRLDILGYAFRRIPERVEEYVPGLEYQVPRKIRSVDDTFFFEKVLPQLADCIRQGKTDQRFRGETLSGMPFFVCGGGARMKFYGRAAGEINSRWKGGLSLEQTRLPVPERFAAPGLAPADFDRVSVAYGLSCQTLGEIIRKQDIPPLVPVSHADYRDGFVDKDMM